MFLYKSIIETKIGKMITLGDHESLYLLVFLDDPNLNKKILKIEKEFGAKIIEGKSKPINFISEELALYFEGNLKIFKTNLKFFGTIFQIKVWNELLKISYGSKVSYLEIAKRICNSNFSRAVGNANAFNNFFIIVPCHRVIKSNNEIGNYGGGINRKIWLLAQEENNK